MTPDERDPGGATPGGEGAEGVAHEPYEGEGETGEYQAYAGDGESGEHGQGGETGDDEPFVEPSEPADREPYEHGETGDYDAYRGQGDSGEHEAYAAEGETEESAPDAGTGEHPVPDDTGKQPVLHDPDGEPPHGAAPEGLAAGFVACPTCGQPAERRQLVCLNCGGRVALAHGRSFITEPIVPLIVAVVVLGAALFGFAVSEITSGADDGEGETARTAPAAPAVVEDEGQPTATQPDTGTSAGAQPGETSGTRVARRNPLAWPRGLSAHTVVLVTTSDRAGALRIAKEARGTGLEAGLLPSDPYNLGTGLWIVFSGRFSTREGAARQAAQLARRYPGAYPQLIQRSQ